MRRQDRVSVSRRYRAISIRPSFTVQPRSSVRVRGRTNRGFSKTRKETSPTAKPNQSRISKKDMREGRVGLSANKKTRLAGGLVELGGAGVRPKPTKTRRSGFILTACLRAQFRSLFVSRNLPHVNVAYIVCDAIREANFF